MGEKEQREEQKTERALRGGDEAIKDVEPEPKEGAAVNGGGSDSRPWL